MRAFGNCASNGRHGHRRHEECLDNDEYEIIPEAESAREPLLSEKDSSIIKEEADIPVQATEGASDTTHRSVAMSESGDEANGIYDTIRGIYNIGVEESQDKAALYSRMMHYYAENAVTMPQPSQRRTTPIMWYMLAILISNPIIGLYTMGHFKSWETWVTRDVIVAGSLDNALAPNPPAATTITQSNWLSFWGYIEPAKQQQPMVVTQEELDMMNSTAKVLSRKVRGYACYEIFGELVFAIFSLSLLCASNVCCTNGRHRAQSMIPLIGVLYTVIYKILAMYILIISFKILVFYAVAAYPEHMGMLPAILLKLLAISGTNPADSMQRTAMSRLLKLDSNGHKWVIIYCLENVYITISDSIETIYASSRVIKRGLRKIIKRLRRQQDLVYFTMGSSSDMQEANEAYMQTSCSYMLLDSLLNKTAGVHETYIHNMYNRGVTGVGTYLNSVNVQQYQDGIELMGMKIMNQVRGEQASENPEV